MPYRQQSITWSNAAPVHWRIYVELVGDEFNELHRLVLKTVIQIEHVIFGNKDIAISAISLRLSGIWSKPLLLKTNSQKGLSGGLHHYPYDRLIGLAYRADNNWLLMSLLLSIALLWGSLNYPGAQLNEVQSTVHRWQKATLRMRWIANLI